jgi:uncharacterized membrane protein YiaA
MTKDFKHLAIVFVIAGLGLCAVGAYMAIKSTDGWGWFLFAGILVMGGVTYSSDGKDNEEEDDEADD